MKYIWIWKELKKYKFTFFIALFLVGVDAICTFLFPQYITNIIDYAVPYKDMPYLLENVILLLLVNLISLFMGINLNYLFFHSSNNFVTEIKKKLVDGVFSFNGLSISTKMNKFMTCITEDTYMIEFIASRILATTVLDLVTLIIILIILVQINKSVLILVLIVFPFLLVMQYMFNKKIKQANSEMLKYRDNSNKLIRELVNYIYEYIAINGKRYFSDRFFPLENNLKSKKIDICMLKTYNSFLPNIVNAVSFSFVIGICSYEIIVGKSSIGSLAVIIMYIRQLSSIFVRIITMFGEMQRIFVSVKRIDEIIGKNYD